MPVEITAGSSHDRLSWPSAASSCEKQALQGIPPIFCHGTSGTACKNAATIIQMTTSATP